MGEKKRLMNNFSEEDEELIRSFLFTNPHGDDSFIYPQPLIAGEELSPLMSAYSRTHIPMQDRVLQFLDVAKVEQTKAILPLIKPLMETFRLPDGTLKISQRTADFNQEWVLAHGHSSIKEETALFGHTENISDITGKKITGHPLIKPQVKSTRYISYKSVMDLALTDEDVRSLPNSGKFFEYIDGMSKKYLALTEELAGKVHAHPYTAHTIEFLRKPENIEKVVQSDIRKEQRKDRSFQPDDSWITRAREKVYKSLEGEEALKDIRKFVLDSSRSYLTAATRTSMGYSVDARTLEEVITDLLSSPRIEDQKRGQSIWNEAKKLAPVLMGEKSHVKVDMWKVNNEKELRGYLQENLLFGSLEPRNHGNPKVNMITPKTMEMYNDRFNAALVVFPYTDASLSDIMHTLTNNNVNDILEKAHKYRGEHDVLHPAISHGGLMFELTMGYHGYRDTFRHRKGSRSTQLLTTRLGFETPAILKAFGMEKGYEQDMKVAADLYEEARKTSPHTAEKVVPFGAICRALHSWQPNQVGYIGKLRSNIETGNRTYVEKTREMMDAVSKIMPETAKYFKFDTREYPPELWKKGYGWYDSIQGGKQ
ncbi:FAD-dependent thymidylate synthase [Candidatus Pacearchaeota archaeon]|nr:FAD-dependent thymidylate synthase [Candidatus Pacearchaeota archaeon]